MEFPLAPPCLRNVGTLFLWSVVYREKVCIFGSRRHGRVDECGDTASSVAIPFLVMFLGPRSMSLRHPLRVRLAYVKFVVRS